MITLLYPEFILRAEYRRKTLDGALRDCATALHGLGSSIARIVVGNDLTTLDAQQAPNGVFVIWGYAEMWEMRICGNNR